MLSIRFCDVGGNFQVKKFEFYWLVDFSGLMTGDRVATTNRAIRECLAHSKYAADDNFGNQSCVR